ncbi:SA1362 family protein [Bacillus carboniphilus]|uniref:SA1362 family protein n=1 Tax=Bacillus carboniphilus TaxID=86663 RepID=A0ABY9JWY0_9BACI|nr:SA1362 family protein [Bacillus carboniphilus]WLR43902.1 SA1362 family protein [Bacillus carboniphilus]
MNKIITYWIFLLIISLATIGLLFSILYDTKNFFSTLLVWIIVISIIFLVIRFIMSKNKGTEYQSFVKAAKKSKKRHNKNRPSVKRREFNKKLNSCH